MQRDQTALIRAVLALTETGETFLVFLPAPITDEAHARPPTDDRIALFGVQPLVHQIDVTEQYAVARYTANATRRPARIVRMPEVNCVPT